MNAVFLILAGVALVASFLLQPAVPLGDAAVFEYIGRELASGAHLYRDLWDNKLPSIYYVNALWWTAFGGNFALHALAETAIDAGSFALFALLLRRLGVARWAPATLLFAILYLFVGGSLDQTEHYAVPLILGGLLCGVCGRRIAAAVLLVGASTFWLPSVAVGAVPLLATGTRRERITLVLAALAAGACFAAAFVAAFGAATARELANSWFSYQAGNYAGTSTLQPHRFALPFLSPRYYVQSGLGLMVAAVAVFWTRERTPAFRFALAWAVTAVVVAFALGRPAVHYFLPAYPALAMLLALQPIALSAVRRRWYFAAAAGCFAVLMPFVAARDAGRPFFGTAASIRYTGDLVRATFGDHAVGLLPWEIYLTADALPPSRFFLAQGNVQFARRRDRWVRHPIVFVDAADLRFNGVTPPADLAYTCENPQTLPYVIRAERPIGGTTCRHT